MLIGYNKILKTHNAIDLYNIKTIIAYDKQQIKIVYKDNNVEIFNELKYE